MKIRKLDSHVTKGVILIGLTQSGKSTLGNMLLTTDLCEGKGHINRLFQVGGLGESCTDSLKSSIINYNDFSIEILDTPGLSDTNDRDEEFFRKILEKFRDNYELHQIIIVINRNSVFDDKFKNKFKMYQQIFSNLFRSSTMVVMTKFTEEDERIIMLNQNLKADEFAKLYEEKIYKMLEIRSPVFLVNAEPITKKDFERCENLRENLNKRLGQSFFLTKNDKVTKPDFLVAKSRKIVRDLTIEDDKIKERIEQLKRLLIGTKRVIEVEEKINIKAVGLIDTKWFCCFPLFHNVKVAQSFELFDGEVYSAIEIMCNEFKKRSIEINEEIIKYKQDSMKIIDVLRLMDDN